MKKHNLLTLVLIGLCLAVFYGYRMWDGLGTDVTPPQIHFESEMPEISVKSPRDDLLAGTTATDNKDGDVTASLVVEDIRIENAAEGIVTVSVAAFDSSGNVAKAQHEVRYTDYHSPRFQLSRPFVFSQNSGVDVLNFISVEDLIDGDISTNIRVTSLSENSISSIGIHDVEFRVTNSMGDTSKLVIPVEVASSGIYDATLELTDYLIYLSEGDSFRAEDYLDSFTLQRTVTSLRNGLPKDFSLRLTGIVNTQKPGVYVISYYVSNTVSNGLSAASERVYTAYSKLVVVVEG